MVWKKNTSSLVFFLILSVHFTAAFVSATPPKADGFMAKLERVMADLDMPDKCHPMILEQANRSKDVCADVIGPKNSTKQGVGPCSKLIVLVPKKRGFTELVEVGKQCEVKGGFSIAIFCYALRQLTFKVTPIFIPFVNKSEESKGSYDELLMYIKKENCTAVAGDVTIRGSRAQYIHFTAPYMSSEVYMLVRASPVWNQTLLTLVKPFTLRLWLAIIGACIFIGGGIAVLEYREGNPEFMIPFYRKLALVIWFPISTFFFNEGRIVNRCSKAVLVMWLSMIFIVMQIYTACLSSWLTLDQLHPKLSTNCDKNIGYQSGSFLQNFAMNFTRCSPDKELPLSTIDEYKKALSDGSVNVIFDEVPYIDLFLARYNSNYMKSGPIIQEPGIAFAFPIGSPLAPTFSKAVINVTESQDMINMKKKYLGFSTTDQSQTAHDHALPQSLDVHSFIGLFIVMGAVTIGAIIWSEFTLLRIPITQILPSPSIHK